MALSINERLLYAHTNDGKVVRGGNNTRQMCAVTRCGDAQRATRCVTLALAAADWSETILLNGPVSDSSLLLERYVCNRIIALYSTFIAGTRSRFAALCNYLIQLF